MFAQFEGDLVSLRSCSLPERRAIFQRHHLDTLSGRFRQKIRLGLYVVNLARREDVNALKIGEPT
jgi:hypothetical protein